MKELLNSKIKFSNFDLDKDGVGNLEDCNPFDSRKTEFGISNKKIRTFRGYNVEDYFYDSKTRSYVLIAGAKPVKRGLFG